MNVLHLSPAYFSDNSYIGGGERWTTELAAAMARCVPTTLVSFGRRAERRHEGDLRTVVLRSPVAEGENAMGAASWRILPELVRADVIHCHQIQTPLTDMAVLANLVLRRRIFGTDLGGGVPRRTEHLGLHRRLRFIHLSAFSAGLRRAGFAPGPIVYGGAHLPPLAGAPPRDPCKVVTLGRLLAHKGANYAVDAAQPHWKLYLIGRPYDSRYLELLRSRIRFPQTHLVMDADDSEVRDHLLSASIAVFPSVIHNVLGGVAPHAELLGLAVLEAMAAGCCVVASDICSHPELIEPGETGFLVPPGDVAALRRRVDALIEHPEEARKIGANARQRVAEFFSWGATARRCLEAYQVEVQVP